MMINVKTTKQAETKRAPDVHPVSERAPRVNAGTNPVFTGRACTSAFTIIELLVVISIIVLLTGILLPSILRAKSLAYLATTKAYITQLETGALRYQQEKKYFPGQDGVNTAGYTASQVLVSELMGITRKTNNEFENLNDYPPTSPYVEYKTDRVATIKDVNNVNRQYTPIDLFPASDASAILYYPSRLGNSGSLASFGFGDNNAYTSNDAQTENNFAGLIWDTRFGKGNTASGKTTWGTDVPDTGVANKAYNADTFLLFGKGVNDRDEAWSWFTPTSAKNF